jgi:hypothetical protein
VSGGTLPKAIKFFVEATKDAGIELSPYIGKIRATGPRSIGSRAKKTNGEKQNNILPREEPLPLAQIGDASWQQLFLSKMPNFDPAWSEEVKIEWFKGMNKVMEEFKK